MALFRKKRFLHVSAPRASVKTKPEEARKPAPREEKKPEIPVLDEDEQEEPEMPAIIEEEQTQPELPAIIEEKAAKEAPAGEADNTAAAPILCDSYYKFGKAGEADNTAAAPIIPVKKEESKETDYINCTVSQDTKKNVFDEIAYRQKAGEPKVHTAIIIEERLRKSPWLEPATAPPLTDTTQTYTRKHSHAIKGKKQYLYGTILKTVKDDVDNEQRYRRDHGEPKITRSHVFEERMRKAWFTNPAGESAIIIDESESEVPELIENEDAEISNTAAAETTEEAIQSNETEQSPESQQS